MRRFTWFLVALAACGGSRPRTAQDSGAAEADRAAAPAGPAPANSDGIEVYPAADLARVASDLAKGSGGSGRTIGGHPTFHYVESRRALNGVPEVHDRWIDVTVVQAGRATMLAGGRVDGARVISDGERRGGTIVGGTPHAIATGDLLVIPAGVPHQFQVARGDTVVYLTIKVINSMSR